MYNDRKRAHISISSASEFQSPIKTVGLDIVPLMLQKCSDEVLWNLFFIDKSGRLEQNILRNLSIRGVKRSEARSSLNNRDYLEFFRIRLIDENLLVSLKEDDALEHCILWDIFSKELKEQKFRVRQLALLDFNHDGVSTLKKFLPATQMFVESLALYGDTYNSLAAEDVLELYKPKEIQCFGATTLISNRHVLEAEHLEIANYSGAWEKLIEFIGHTLILRDTVLPLDVVDFLLQSHRLHNLDILISYNEFVQFRYRQLLQLIVILDDRQENVELEYQDWRITFEDKPNGIVFMSCIRRT